MDKSSKILVTGASGLIGSALVRLLKSEGYERLLIPTHDELELMDQDAVSDYFFTKKPEYVFHLASVVGGIGENSQYPTKFIYNNTIMHCNIFNKAIFHNVKKVLFPGSACAYPRDCDQPIKESSFLTGMPEPTNLAYAIAKQNGIVMAQSYAKEYGLNVVLPMIANTYGVGDRSSHVIPMMIDKLKNDPNPIFWGTGNVLREFIYADDVADAFLFLMRNYDSPEIINVGTMEEISINDLRLLICRILKWSGYSLNDCTQPDGIPRKCLDSSRLYAMGWKPKVSLEEGLRRICANQ